MNKNDLFDAFRKTSCESGEATRKALNNIFDRDAQREAEEAQRKANEAAAAYHAAV